MIDVNTFQSDATAFPSLNEQYIPTVLVVAAAAEYKNIDMTIKAVAHAGYRLIWCGDGPLKDQLIEFANSLFKEGDFRWLKVPLASMPAIYREADLFTLASKKDVEAYGLVYLEAMSSGLRCVATDDEVRREICGDEGIYVDPGDIVNYANGLKEAWQKTQHLGFLDLDLRQNSAHSITMSYIDVIKHVVRVEQ